MGEGEVMGIGWACTIAWVLHWQSNAGREESLLGHFLKYFELRFTWPQWVCSNLARTLEVFSCL